MNEKIVKTEGKELESVTPRHPLTSFEEMDQIFERMFDEFFPRGWLRPFHLGRPWMPELAFETRAPRVNLIDRDDDVLVRAELPGVTKKDLNVSLTEDTRDHSRGDWAGGKGGRGELLPARDHARGVFPHLASALPCQGR